MEPEGTPVDFDLTVESARTNGVYRVSVYKFVRRLWYLVGRDCVRSQRHHDNKYGEMLASNDDPSAAR
jgi:hypothetical protein